MRRNVISFSKLPNDLCCYLFARPRVSLPGCDGECQEYLPRPELSSGYALWLEELLNAPQDFLVFYKLIRVGLFDIPLHRRRKAYFLLKHLHGSSLYHLRGISARARGDLL
jgi:hypothetical protein